MSLSEPRAGHVVVVGDVMTDIIVRPEGPIVHGSDRRAAIAMLPGGSGANQAAWLARFGLPVMLAARVGREDAEAHAAALRRHGVTPALAVDERLGSGRLVALLAPDGERSFLTDRGANEALCRADLPDALLDGAALLHVSAYALVSPGPRAAVLDFLGAARRRGVPVTIDPASAGFLRDLGPANVLAWIRGAAMLFPNVDEAEALTGLADEEGQLRHLAALFDLVVLKRGGRGAAAARGTARWSVAGPAVAAVDTTGAGDAFLAAFLAAHLAGAQIEACLARGVAAGAQAVSVPGGQPR